MADESEPTDAPSDTDARRKRRRDPELDAMIQKMLVDLEPYRGRIFNGPVDFGQIATLLAASGPAAVVAREALRQRGETMRERIRQDGMTQRALLAGSTTDGATSDGEPPADDTNSSGPRSP